MDVLVLVVLETKQPATGQDRGGLLNVMTWGCWALSFSYDTGLGEIAQSMLILTANGILKIAPP